MKRTSDRHSVKMYYRIRFKSFPKEFLFELMQKKQVRVRDVIYITKKNFKLKRSTLILFCDDDPLHGLDDMDVVVSGKTYIVKRLPLSNDVVNNK